MLKVFLLCNMYPSHPFNLLIPANSQGKHLQPKCQGSTSYPMVICGKHTESVDSLRFPVRKLIYKCWENTLTTSPTAAPPPGHRRMPIVRIGRGSAQTIMILWMEEILHQLIDGLHPIIHRVSTIQGGAGFLNHPQYGTCISIVEIWTPQLW